MKRDMIKNEEEFELDSEIEFCRFTENFLCLDYKEDKYNFNMANVCDYLSKNPGITNLRISHTSLDQKDISSLATALRTLKKLKFSHVHLSDEGMRLLALNSATTNFVFNFCKITDQQASHLAAITSPTKLSITEDKKLHISGTELDALTNNTQLNTFDLESSTISEAVLKVLVNKLFLTYLDLNKPCKIGYQNGNLTSLELDGNQIGDDGVTVFKHNRTLTNLSLSENGITAPGARALASSHVITHLNLTNNQIGDKGAGAFKSNHTIIVLNLTSCGISSLGADELAGNKKITRLVLQDNNIGDLGAAAFCDHPSITELNLYNCGIGEQGALQLADTKTITRLNLKENKIGDRGAAAFQTNRSITDLNLTNCNIGSQGGIELSKNSAITCLGLSWNEIGDAGAAAFKDNTSLINLYMERCKITYRGAIELAKNKTIKVLGLSKNKIGDSGAVAFIDNTSLTELHLDQNGISDAGVSALMLNQSITYLSVCDYILEVWTPLTAYFLFANRSLRYHYRLSGFNQLSHFLPGVVKEIKKISRGNRLFQQEYPDKVRREIIECLEIDVLVNLVCEYAKGEFPFQYGLLKNMPEAQEAIDHLCEKAPGLRNRFDFTLLEDWKPLDPLETEYFSEFVKNDNGTEMPCLAIEKIEMIPYLLNYLNLNPAIKKLVAIIWCPFDKAVSLLARNNTLTSLILNCVNDYSLDKGLVALSSNRSLTHLRISPFGANLFLSRQGMAELLKNTVLKILELSYAKLDHDIAHALFTHPSLEKLTLRPWKFINMDFSHLRESHLQTLDLSYIQGQSGDDVVRILSRHPVLTSLRLEDCKISKDGLAQLLELKTLKVLNVRNNNIDDQGVCILSKHPGINELTLEGRRISYQGINFFLKEKKNVLKSFSYKGEPGVPKNEPIDDLIRGFSDCSVLTSLTLQECGIGPKGAALLLECKNLEHLDLSDNPVGDEGVHCLVSHPKLNSLYLNNCGIGDEGVTALAKNPCLQRLSLRYNSEIKYIALVALAYNQTITELDFYTEHNRQLFSSKLALLLLCNQTLRYFNSAATSCYESIFSVHNNDPLIALGGRNFKLQNEYDSVVKLSFLALTPLPPQLTNMVLEYTKGEYPSRYQLLHDHVTLDLIRNPEMIGSSL